MKKIILLVAASFSLLSTQAQLTFNIETTVGNGTLVLNTNHLVYTGDNGNAAGYADAPDILTFQGITYSNLNFSVYNNSWITAYNDGFQIRVDNLKDPSLWRMEFDVSGNSALVNGVSRDDLITVLSSFEALKTPGFSASIVYNQPYAPYRQLTGTVTSFQLQRGPSIATAGVQGNQFGFDVVANPGATAVVEACSTVSSANPVWTPIQTNTLASGSWHFSDPGWTNHPVQLYRIRMQ